METVRNRRLTVVTDHATFLVATVRVGAALEIVSLVHQAAIVNKCVLCCTIILRQAIWIQLEIVLINVVSISKVSFAFGHRVLMKRRSFSVQQQSKPTRDVDDCQ